MKLHLLAVTALVVAGLAGCSEPPAAPAQPAPAPAPQAEAAAPPQISEERQGILTDTQREGLNTANQVSNVLEDAEKKRREQMEPQGL